MSDWVPESQRVGEDVDSHAAKIAAMFGGQSQGGGVPAKRNFGISKKASNPKLLLAKSESKENLNENENNKGVVDERPTSPSKAPNKRPSSDDLSDAVVPESVTTVSDWKAKMEQRQKAANDMPKIRRRSIDMNDVTKDEDVSVSRQTDAASTRRDELNSLATGGTRGTAQTSPNRFETMRSRSNTLPNLSQKKTTFSQQPPKSGGDVASPPKTPGSALRFRSQSSNTDACPTCGKPVYAVEELKVDGQKYHKTCFRCTMCNKQLSAGGYAKVHGKAYCKPHFAQLFKTKGNYDEGFGQVQRKRAWTVSVSDAGSC